MDGGVGGGWVDGGMEDGVSGWAGGWIEKHGRAGLVMRQLSSHVLLLGGLEFAGSDPRGRHGTAWQKPCCGRHPTYNVEEDGHEC